MESTRWRRSGLYKCCLVDDASEQLVAKQVQVCEGRVEAEWL